MNQVARAMVPENVASEEVLIVALELGATEWRVAYTEGVKLRGGRLAARDLSGLGSLLEKAKQRCGLSADARVVSCYEAGRDGFWLDRYLRSEGIENIVVDPASIEVPQGRNRRKTDSLDARKLATMLVRHTRGERGMWSVVRVPSDAVEDERRIQRERNRLMKERTQHRNRLGGLLALHGLEVPLGRDLLVRLESARRWDGSKLPPHALRELEREYERLLIVEGQLKALQKEERARLKSPQTVGEHKAAKLVRLKGLGENSARPMVTEFFWREFRNRKEVGGASGLTPTPWMSGSISRDQGISKAGNRRIRALAVEIAWLWVRHQPEHKHTKWFNERFAGGGKRMRKVGIAAVARKLLVDFWRYLEHDVLPEGAVLKA